MVARLFETFEKNEVMKSVPALSRSPWSWVPTLYLAEGIPYVAVMSIAVIMYDRMGISHTDIAFYTAWLYLPWVIKPLWSPFVDILHTRRWWIVAMQFLVGAAMAGVALTLPAPFFFRATLAFFWLMAFSSATHDIAADGFYMLALDTHQQSFFVGIRSTFYRIAMIAGQGLLVMLAGLFEVYTRVEVAWLLTFGIMALLFFVFAFYHLFLLPRPQADKASAVAAADIWRELGETFRSFFRKPGIGVALLFLLTYRLAEAQLVKMSSLFLLDARPDGGLALTTGQVGFVYGTVGVIALTVGGLIGGWVVSRYGLRRCLWPMALMLTLPNLVYVYLSLLQPDSLVVVNACVAVEQLGYGFGFTAYMLYMISFSEGAHATAHYALCTAFMALGMMLPGMVAGWIADWVGYTFFFVWIMICTLPVFVLLPFLKIPENFGLKSPGNKSEK